MILSTVPDGFALKNFCYFTILEKTSNSNLICAKENATIKLIERGWGTLSEKLQEKPKYPDKEDIITIPNNLEIEKLYHKILKYEDAITNLKDQLNDDDLKISNFDRIISNQDGTISYLKQEITHLESEIIFLKDQLDDDLKISNFDRIISNQDGTISYLKQEITHLESEIIFLKDQLDAALDYTTTSGTISHTSPIH